MAKMTKTQARRRLNEIKSKMFKLYEGGYCSLKDLDAVMKITKTRINQLK